MNAARARRTLARDARLSGRGLFAGLECTLVIRPSVQGGVAFVRSDLPGTGQIPALVSHAGSDPRLPGRHTILAADPSHPPGPRHAAALTVEHVLSALAGLGVTDALLDLTGPEVPIGDGSAGFLVEAISNAGVRDLGSDAVPIVVRDRVEVRSTDGSAEIVAEPSSDDRLHLAYTLDYTAIGGPPRQTFSWTWDESSYARDIAPARTFCLVREAEAMRRAGLFEWVTPRDMLVLTDDGTPVDNVLRFPDEPARHKLLDLLGDLSLAGAPIVGRITAVRSGHALNAQMAGALRRQACVGS